jgi:hypothetical protein
MMIILDSCKRGEGRPSRMEETAYLARLFMSLLTIQSRTERRRRAKRLAWWQTLGPFGPGVIPRFLLGHLNDAEETRLG